MRRRWARRRTEPPLPIAAPAVGWRGPGQLSSFGSPQSNLLKLDAEGGTGSGVDGEELPLLFLGGVVGRVPLAPGDEPPAREVGDLHPAVVGGVLRVPLPARLAA